jgi:hypothetical protein
MKLYYVDDSSLITQSENSKNLYLSDRRGSGFVLNKNRLETTIYEKDIYFGTTILKDKKTDVYLREDARQGSAELAVNGDIYCLVGGAKQEVELAILTSVFSKIQTNNGLSSSKIFVDEHVIDGNSFTLFYDVVNETCREIKSSDFRPDYLHGEYYYTPVFPTPYLLKSDDKLNIEWEINKTKDNSKNGSSFTYPRRLDETVPPPILLYGNSVVVNLTAKVAYRESLTKKIFNKNGDLSSMDSETYFTEGGLYCLDKGDGKGRFLCKLMI